MTAKRFTIKPSMIVDDVTVIIDNQKEYTFPVLDSTLNYMFCKVLNEQHETIQRLKQNIDELMSVDVEEDLLKENEQLKNKINVLEDDNETYHKSLEQLNLYIKRFIPTKCTNEFKDCKTNRYYWLDHEGNFEGCLELLNLLDCENERLKFENRELKGRLMVYEEQLKGDVE